MLADASSPQTSGFVPSAAGLGRSVGDTGAYTGGMYSGDIQIVSSINDDTFMGEYAHEGITYSNAFSRQLIVRQRLPPPPVDNFSSLLGGLDNIICPTTADILKRLPRSHASGDAATLSALDILEVCQHAGIVTPISDMHAAGFNFAAAAYVTAIDTIVCGQAVNRAWPDRPDRLGQELRRITGGGGAGGDASGGGARPPPHRVTPCRRLSRAWRRMRRPIGNFWHARCQLPSRMNA